MHAQARYGALFVTGAFGTIGTALLVLIGVALGHGAAILQPLDGARDNVIWFFGVMIVGLTILTQILQTFALRALGAGTFSVIASYGSLIYGMLGAYFILGERLTPIGLIAGALLALALGLAVVPVSTRGSARRSPQS